MTDIIGFQKSNNRQQKIRQDGQIIYTTNIISNLINNTITKTNKFIVYYVASTGIWQTRLNRIGNNVGATLTTFNDITSNIGATGASSKIGFNATTNKTVVGVPIYFQNNSTSAVSITGETNLNTNSEILIYSLLNTLQTGGGSGVSFSTTNYNFTITNTLNKYLFINQVIILPYSALTINAEIIFRIRTDSIIGPIIAEQRFYNSSSIGVINANLMAVVLNPSSLYYTIQLTSGSFTRAGSNTNLLTTINQI
jgi:hypothetical protein